MKLNPNVWIVSDVGMINGTIEGAIPGVMDISIRFLHIPIGLRHEDHIQVNIGRAQSELLCLSQIENHEDQAGRQEGDRELDIKSSKIPIGSAGLIDLPRSMDGIKIVIVKKCDL
jgi:hypothetical protein